MKVLSLKGTDYKGTTCLLACLLSFEESTSCCLLVLVLLPIKSLKTLMQRMSAAMGFGFWLVPWSSVRFTGSQAKH